MSTVSGIALSGNPPATSADAGMDLHLPVRVSRQPLWLVWSAGFVVVPVLVWWGYHGCAALLGLAVIGEAVMAFRRQRNAPVALCTQGMRWWLVTQDGEMTGPFWLDEQTRHGSSWMTLCLRDADKRRRYVLLGRWSMEAEAWRQLMWQVLEQASRLRRLRGG